MVQFCGNTVRKIIGENWKAKYANLKEVEWKKIEFIMYMNI